MTLFLTVDPVLVLAATYLLALLFAGSAISKLMNLAAFEGVVQNFRLLPHPLIKAVAWLLPPTELAVAFGLAVTSSRPYAAFAAVLLLITFTIAIAINLRRGRHSIDCGCFGSVLRQTLSWSLVARNTALIALATMLAISSPPVQSLHWLGVLTVIAGALTLIIADLVASQLRSNDIALRTQPSRKRQT